MDIHKVIGKLPRSKRGFVLPYHKYTGPYNPLNEQLDEYDKPLAGQEPYNAVDAISMRHDICYRDNETKEGKHARDDDMLKDLDVGTQRHPGNGRQGTRTNDNRRKEKAWLGNRVE